MSTNKNLEDAQKQSFDDIDNTNTIQKVKDTTAHTKLDSIISGLGGATNEALEVDYTSTANVVYVGNAVIGTATSSALWKITKFDFTTGVSQTWADTDDNYDNIWDNRTGLTYG